MAWAGRSVRPWLVILAPARNHFSVIPLSRAVAAIRAHRPLPPRPFDDLARVRPSTALGEMSESKRQLEQMLGHPVVDFADPYGNFKGYFAGWARATDTSRDEISPGKLYLNYSRGAG